jgi:outer membrane protein OmpA-like peptidoglycan-associated protein
LNLASYNMRKRIALTVTTVLVTFFAAFSQEDIFLTNPSFEDFPRHSAPPKGWTDCGFPGESPPDVQPSGDFGVYREAMYGKTYLGLVVRDNETWEKVSQRLSTPMQSGQCYEFSLALAKSGYYISKSRLTDNSTNYVTPVKIRIYGGNGLCNESQLLDETGLIDHRQWKEYKFKFKPKNNYSYIIIQAFYKEATLFPYNGNVLVDNASAITPIPCDEPVPDAPQIIDEPIEPVIAEVPDPPVNTQPKGQDNQQPAPVTPTPTPPVVEPAAPKSEKTISGVTRSEMNAGDKIVLNNLYFEADSSRIRSESTTALDELYEFLQTYKDVSIEIGGHTNSYPPDDYCFRLSTARAKAVADYLSAKGVKRDRLKYKGYGKREPIASNDTKAGRNKNQRVEIKILEMRGG